MLAELDIATPPGTPLARHAGKLLIIADNVDQQQCVSSLMGDFETLFYVPVACAET